MAYQIFEHSNGDIYVDYTVSQNQIANTSTITINAIYFRSHNWYGVNFYGEGGLYINGTQVVAFNNSITYSCRVDSRDTWVLVSNSAGSQSVTVNHNANGTGGFYMYPHGRSGTSYNDFNMFCLSSSSGNAEYNENRYVSLPTIDRAAPTITLSAAAASTTSATLSVSANVACDYWWYKVDSGSWTAFTPTNGAYTITGLSSASHTIQVAARKTSNQVIGYSSSVTVDLTAPTITASISDVTSSGMSVSASSNVTCDVWQYKVGSGSWTNIPNATEGTSASFTLTGLNPNTSYSVTVRARKKSNQLYGTSAAVSATTLGGSLLHSMANVTMDDASPAASFVATVYGSFYHKLRIYAEDGTTLLRTLNFASLAVGNQQTYPFTIPAATRSALLATFPNAKTCVFKVTLETYTDSTAATLVGTSEMRSFTASTTAANSAPTFTTFTYADTETETADATGNNQILIQGYSHLEVTATAGTALNGATISGYSVSIGDVSASGSSTSLDVGAVNSSGDLTLTVTCADSRGYSTSVSTTVKVLAYSKPRFNTYTLRRRNEIDKLVQLYFTGSVSSIMPSNTERNSIVSILLKYKLTSAPASAYTTINLKTAAEMTISGLTFSYSNAELMELDENLSYDFVFYVYDELGDLTVFEYPDILNQGTPLLAFRKRSSNNNRPRIGVNNPTPVYELDVHGDIAQHDVLVQGFVAELEEEYISNLKSGGYYTQDDAAQATTLRGYPVAKAGLLEVLANPAGMVIQRYTPFDMTVVYVRCYDSLASTPGWTSWKSHTLS